MPNPVPTLIPITIKGLSQKSPSGLSAAGELSDLKNMQILKGGAQGFELSKRYGTLALSTSCDTNVDAPTANARKLTTRNNELVLQTDTALWSWDPSSALWHYRPKNGFSFSSKTTIIEQNNYQKVAPAFAYDPSSDTEIIAWYDERDRCRYSIRNHSTGAFLVHDVVLADSKAFSSVLVVRAFVCNSNFWIFYPEVGTTQLKAAAIPISTPGATPTLYSLATAGIVANISDVYLKGTTFYIGGRNGGTAFVLAAWSASSHTFTGGPYTFGTASISHFSWLDSSLFASSLGFCTNDSTNGLMKWVCSTGLGISSSGVVTTEAGIKNAVGYVDAVGVAQVFYDLVLAFSSTAIKTSLSTAIARSVYIAGKPYISGGNWYLLTRYDSVTQPQFFLFDITNLRFVAKVQVGGPQWAASFYSGIGHAQFPSTLMNGSTIAYPIMAGHMTIGQTLAAPLGVTIQGVDLVEFTTPANLTAPADLGGVLHYPGSIPYLYDGARVVEESFNIQAEAPTPTVGGAGSFTVGTHAWRVTYSWQDANGSISEGVASTPVSFTSTTTNSVNVACPTLRITNRDDVWINLYRNTVSQPAIYRLVGQILNSVVVDTITINDNLQDQDLNARPELYSDAGALDHVTPPSHRIVCQAQNRTFLAGVDQDPDLVWISNEWVPGEAVTYSDSVQMRVQGEITAMTARDRNVIIFTKNSIWVATGEFPDALGSGSIPQPQPLPHKIGAISQDSIIVASTGIFFQSLKGIYLLGWDWSLVYVGADIEDALGTKVITSGIEVPTMNQIRLYTAEGTTFVYDTFFKTWLPFYGQSAASASTYNNVPAYLSPGGIVYIETPGQYSDSGAFISSSATLDFVSPASIKGYSCLFGVQLFGMLPGACYLKAALSYDLQSAVTTNYQWDFTGGSPDGVLSAELKPQKRRASSFGVQIYDVSPGYPTAGFTLQGISLNAGIMTGGARLPAANRAIKL